MTTTGGAPAVIRRPTDAMPMRGLVFGLAPGDFHRAGRTERSLAAAGVAVGREPALTAEALAHRLREAPGALLLARAGAWLADRRPLAPVPHSATGRPLLGLAERGVRVRAFTVQEDPAHPTPGRAALLRAGIPVTAMPPPERLDAADAAARILDLAAAAPPRAVLFWNLIASCKILLADGFTRTPIYDVSPGGMYFSALAKYFAAPRPGLPYLTPRDYGARLAGVVVKYAAEAEAAAALGAPVHVIRNGIAPRAAREADSLPCGLRRAAKSRHCGEQNSPYVEERCPRVLGSVLCLRREFEEQRATEESDHDQRQYAPQIEPWIPAVVLHKEHDYLIQSSARRRGRAGR